MPNQSQAGQRQADQSQPDHHQPDRRQALIKRALLVFLGELERMAVEADGGGQAKEARDYRAIASATRNAAAVRLFKP